MSLSLDDAGAGSNDERPFSAGESPFFLAADFVAEACRLASLPAEAVPALQTAAAEIQRDDNLRDLMTRLHRELFEVSHRPDARPQIQKLNGLGDAAPPVALLLALSGLPLAGSFHDARNIPPEVRRATYQDIALWATEFHDAFEVWGIKPALLGWFMNHLWGELYRLVRLQFILRPFHGQLVAFRNVHTREVLALAEDGIRFRRDGQFDGTSGVYDSQPWVSRLTVDERGARGNPISPRGYALNAPVFLPVDEWQPVLHAGDMMLEMHIPAGEPMSFDACGESMRRAPDFFRTHFPETPFLGFCCTSWLLDSQLPDLLPPSSNLVRFMQEFYCYPRLGDDGQTFERVFGRKPADLTKAPRDTTLRRAILDHVLAGGHMRSGGAFLLTEDLRWGEQVYLHQACVPSHGPRLLDE